MPLIKLFLDICLFRKGPQDAPPSRTLLGISAGAYFLVGLVLMLLEASWLQAVLQVLMEGAMLFGFVWISLQAAARMGRFLQTMTAMLGTDALISSLAVPLVAVVMANPQALIIHLLLLLLMFWHMAVIAHILRHALSQNLAIALGLAIVFVIFSYQIMMMLFGPPPPAT